MRPARPPIDWSSPLGQRALAWALKYTDADPKFRKQRNAERSKKLYEMRKKEAPQCECGRTMKIRTNSGTGEPFWGCSGYPRCKGSRQA